MNPSSKPQTEKLRRRLSILWTHPGQIESLLFGHQQISHVLARPADVHDQPKICDLREAAHKNDVGRLDVAVDDLVSVQISQCLRQTKTEIDTLRQRQPAPLVQFCFVSGNES
jgi:hypothetical protein